MYYLIRAKKSDYLVMRKNVSLIKEKKKEAVLCLANMQGMIDVMHQIVDVEKNESQLSEEQRREADAEIRKKLAALQSMGVELSSLPYRQSR